MHVARLLTVGRSQPLHAGGGEEVQPVLWLEAQRLETRAYGKGHLLKLDKTLVLVGAELKVLPLLVDFLLLAVDHLLDLLRLLVYIDDATRTDSLCIAKLGGRVPQDVVESRDVVVGLHDEAIFGCVVAARHRLAIYLLGIGDFTGVGTSPVCLCLGHQLLEVLWHDGGVCVWRAQSVGRGSMGIKEEGEGDGREGYYRQ